MSNHSASRTLSGRAAFEFYCRYDNSPNTSRACDKAIFYAIHHFKPRNIFPFFAPDEENRCFLGPSGIRAFRLCKEAERILRAERAHVPLHLHANTLNGRSIHHGIQPNHHCTGACPASFQNTVGALSPAAVPLPVWLQASRYPLSHKHAQNGLFCLFCQLINLVHQQHRVVDALVLFVLSAIV